MIKNTNSQKQRLGVWLKRLFYREITFQPFFLKWLKTLNNHSNFSNHSNILKNLRENTLNYYKERQNFRVAIGKSKWENYESFNPDYNLREILDDEIVIEFDNDDWKLTTQAIHDTGINLWNAGYKFEWWEHGGKSPHLHIHNLPISHLEKDKLTLFKKCFIRKYVPVEYLKYADISLTGIHLIALEWASHWKGKYGVKKLISVFDGLNKDSWEVIVN